MDVEKKKGKGGSLKRKEKGPLAPAALKRNMTASKGGDEAKMRTDNIHSNLDAQGRTAIKALQNYYNEQKKQSKSALFPEIDFTIHLLAVYKKAARVNGSNMSAYRKIQLPYPLQSPETSTICLIVRDLHMTDKDYNDPDVDKQAREWQEKLLREQDITGAQITKILTRRQLEREYHTYTDKRSLASAYDLFLVDNTVMKVVHDMCGKEFHKANKYPIAVKTNRPLAPQISRAFRTTLLPVYKLKNRVSVKIGHLGQPLDELAKNLDECIVQLRLHCPGGTKNILALYLQPTSSSPSLPIYADLGSRNEVAMETPKEHKQRLLEERKHPGSRNISGELSTLPEGLDKVVVHPDGRVRVIKDNKEVMFPTLDDEHEERDDILPSKKVRRSTEAIAKRNAFHRTAKRAIWKAQKEAKGKKKTAVKNGRPTAAADDDKEAAAGGQFKFRPVVKVGKGGSKKDRSDTSTSPTEEERTRKRGKNPSAKAVPAGPRETTTTTPSEIPPSAALPKRKKRAAAESAP